MSDINKVVVIGTGFVGLPLALMLASEGVDVVGVDIDENITKAINDESLDLGEAELNSLLQDETVQENLVAQTEPETGDAYIVAVPTPLSQPEKVPNLSHLEKAIDSLVPYITDGDLINIESTVPPLTCETVVGKKLSEAGFEVGEDVHLAHSPERILPGNVFEEIINNDRVIGGATPACTRLATQVYETFLEADMYKTDLLSAELCKLIENTFRDVNVAIANQFALIGAELGVDVSETINLANKHPRVNILTPGIGVGGHCLPVDPWFLNKYSPQKNNLMTTAREINERMPRFVAARIRRAVAMYTDPIILALGAAYKPNTYDRRNSPADDIVEILRQEGYSIAHYDRRVAGVEYDDLQKLVERHEPNVLLQLVPHDETITEINEIRPWLAEHNVDVLQFGGREPLDPTTPIQ